MTVSLESSETLWSWLSVTGDEWLKETKTGGDYD